jgi:hypothetical protein
MSDHDYGVLVEAVRWIEQHSGDDAPVYPHLERLSALVENISRRGQSAPEPPRTIDLRNAPGANAGSSTDRDQA